MNTLRQANLKDIPSIVETRRRSYFTAMPHMPRLHTVSEDVAFFTNSVYPSATLWVVEEEQAVVGFIAYRTEWIDQLYIDPLHQHSGLGSKLLSLAKSANSSLSLWTFQCNQRARNFYEKQGFQAIKMTDGSDNEERQPDILYNWIRTITPY